MNLTTVLTENVFEAINVLYKAKPAESQVQLQKTRKEFEGDVTLVVFPLLKISKKSPDQTANEIGDFLVERGGLVTKYNSVKGFLNLVISDSYYINFLKEIQNIENFGFKAKTENSPVVMVEYSSPNTNKPLHLGHIRNNLLGNSLCRILDANGSKVIKTNIVNDRGIHICKSMIAWQKWGKGETPETCPRKGDHLVGDYYVIFDAEYKKQIKRLVVKGMPEEQAAKEAPLLKEAQEMLRKWENNDPEVHELWRTMNQWVYDGFDVTYKRLGVDFDKIYYESDTYLVGRDTVLKGLKNNIFIQKEDNSVWADLTADGLDQKILLRSDGTSVYMTQDIGTAQLRQNDYNPDKMVYVVGNEQNYHFKVLSIILDKLGFSWAKDLYHMSYGMVELPEGKMKSREGTVVDADDLMDEMIATARNMAIELGKLEGLSPEEKEENYRIIGMGALKYFILKVDPVKNMTFDPKESIDFNGNTGPFIQYTYARIRSVFRKAEELGIAAATGIISLDSLFDKEKSLLKLLHEYPAIVNEAGENNSPAIIANYIYELVKEYNQFYHEHSILKEEDSMKRDFRLVLSENVGKVIKSGMNLLGIDMPERM
ncbi:MAG: arginine--tRNA ligase [Bacteroidales bacterium]|nr:arginine--tRNA ligase [Bacteroidales bacterium]MBN2820136.1 arginine--tRNA ligase [Bacteroidales bacterium]